MTDHRGGAGEDSDPVARDLEADERRDEPFRDVEKRHGDPERGAVHAPDVRRADVAAPVTTDVVAAEEPREHVAEGNRAEEVAAEDDQGVGGHRRPNRQRQNGMEYDAIHPFTTCQSRFSKNASTYEARSVW